MSLHALFYPCTFLRLRRSTHPLLRQNFQRPIYFTAEDFDAFTADRTLCANGNELR
jgi:hypothetical protein